MNGKKTDAITVKYIYSACIQTSTPDVRVLHDPWFSEGIYDGSWYHFPKVLAPLESVGDCDLIYISHIHPDHYDPLFLKSYFEKFGNKKIIIADHQPNHLFGKMLADGIDATILSSPMQIGNTTLEILPHKTGSISDVDSTIVIKYLDSKQRTHCVVNANDIIFDDNMKKNLKSNAGDVDILLCGYTGAGAYPQTYFDLDDPELVSQAEKKKLAFFDRYKSLVDAIQAKMNIPFAGKYILGGSRSNLNAFRGIADPVEVLSIDPCAVVLEDNSGEVDTLHLNPTAIRTEPYSVSLINSRMDEVKSEKMAYERLMTEAEIYQLPLRRLLKIAGCNAVTKSECDHDYYFCFYIDGYDYAVINANKDTKERIRFLGKDCLPAPRSEIYIDPRYLFGLLTHVYHWNNAEIGSQYFTRRYPDKLNRKAQAFLNYLTV